MLQAVVLQRVKNTVQPQAGAFSYQPQATLRIGHNPVEMGGKGLHELEIKGSRAAHSVPPVRAVNPGLGSPPPAPPPSESWSRGAVH